MEVRRITRAVRAADSQFEKSGGTSRHWVTDHFLPCLEKEGLAIVDPKDPADLLALGYVQEPVWLPLKGADFKSLIGCVLAVAEPGVIPHIGMVMPGGLQIMRLGGTPEGFKPTHYQVLNPLPAIPGKGE